MKKTVQELRALALGSPHWKIRNIAVKQLGELKDVEAKDVLLEVIADQRPALWWRRFLGDPFYQVGFTRRNAWQALSKHSPNIEALDEKLIYLGLDDPYYEVRTATWALLSQVLGDNETAPSTSLKENLKHRILQEENFEILTAALGVFERVCDGETLLEWASKVEVIKHWRVRAAYLEALERCCQKGQLNREQVEPLLKSFNLRSEYFRPVFILKEHGSRLERSLKVEV